MVSASEKEKVGSGKQNSTATGQQRPGKMLAERPSKDGNAQRAALDVEGLKGYVRIPYWNKSKQKTDQMTETGQLPWKRSLWLCVSSLELGHW